MSELSVIPELRQCPSQTMSELPELDNVQVVPVTLTWTMSKSVLCAIRVPVEPVLTTTATCGTAVSSSLGSARLPQWSKTQAYAYERLFKPVSS